MPMHKKLLSIWIANILDIIIILSWNQCLKHFLIWYYNYAITDFNTAPILATLDLYVGSIAYLCTKLLLATSFVDHKCIRNIKAPTPRAVYTLHCKHGRSLDVFYISPSVSTLALRQLVVDENTITDAFSLSIDEVPPKTHSRAHS